MTMKRPEVKSLFKYYPVTRYSLVTLATMRFWFSKPSRFNDPFDLAYEIIPEISAGRVVEAIRNDAVRKGASPNQVEVEINKFLSQSGCKEPSEIVRLPHLSELIRNKIKDLGIFCMSQTLKNILMWSYYSDGHRGFCVEFERSENNLLGNWEKTRPVEYVPELPKFTLESFTKVEDENGSPEKYAFTKASIWEKEEEWRVVLSEGDRLYESPGKVLNIYFGLNMGWEHCSLIKKILSSCPEIGLWKVIKGADDYEMGFVKMPTRGGILSAWASGSIESK